MSGPGVITALGACYGCGTRFQFCPDCVVSVHVDPVTHRPPDVDAEGHHQEPDPAAVARAVRRELCDGCVGKVNRRLSPGRHLESGAERHARHVTG